MATDYAYTSLKDVLADGKIYHVYGLVKFFREPRRTRGPDWNMLVVLTDESLGYDAKVTFNLFLKDVSRFPHLTRVGAIVRFHRVRFNLHNGQLQGVISPGFSALVFDHGSSQPKATNENYTYTERDQHRVNELKQWSEPFVAQEIGEFAKRIKDIAANQFFDLHCQVIGEVKLSDVHVVLKVWDGTLPNGQVHIVKTVEDSDPRVQYDQVTYPHVKDFLVDVSVYDDHVQEADSILLGDYVTFCNLRAFVPIPLRSDPDGGADRVELCLHHGTSYGRCLKTMDENDATKLRQDLNKILQEANVDDSRGESSEQNRDKNPRSGEISRTGESRSGNANAVMTSALNALEKPMAMEIYPTAAAWLERLNMNSTREPLALGSLFPNLFELTDANCIVQFKVKVAAVPKDACETLVLFCGHCHFLSAVPTNNREFDLPRGALKRLRDRNIKVKNDSGGKKRGENGKVGKKFRENICRVPLRSMCPSLYNVKALKLSSSEWLKETKPCLNVQGVRTYYKCPKCSQGEEDPCVLNYKFFLDVLLRDGTGDVRTVLFDDRILINDVTVVAHDVIVDRRALEGYKRWLRQLSGENVSRGGGGGCEYRASVRVHRQKSLRSNNGCLYQLLKLTPK